MVLTVVEVVEVVVDEEELPPQAVAMKSRGSANAANRESFIHVFLCDYSINLDHRFLQHPYHFTFFEMKSSLMQPSGWHRDLVYTFTKRTLQERKRQSCFVVIVEQVILKEQHSVRNVAHL